MTKKKEYKVTRPMHAPVHPGQIIRDEVIDPLGFTVGEMAQWLGVDRTTLSRLINGHASISVEMALRLSKALGTSAESWLGMQQAYDIWLERQQKPAYLTHIKPITPEAWV